MEYKGQYADNCLNSVAALTRSMYNRLFLWLAEPCNRTLTDPSMKKVNFIGVLDSADFEIVESNTFEEICISLFNEKLRQFVNHHMVALEVSDDDAKEEFDKTKSNKPVKINYIQKERLLLIPYDSYCKN